MKVCKTSKGTQLGFSLLEVIISLSLIVILALGLTTVMRNSFDIREGLSQNARVNHRLAAAMTKVVNDLEHAYIVSEKEVTRTNNVYLREVKTTFEIEVGSNSDVLRFTTRSHVPRTKHANEGDSTFVVYKMQEDPDTGRMNLMRGEAKRKPTDFREEPPLRVLAANIISFKVQSWRGDDWSKERWDSNRSDTRGLMPRMIKIEIIAHDDEPDPEQTSSRQLSTATEQGTKIMTIVTIPSTTIMGDLRPSTSAIRWEKL